MTYFNSTFCTVVDMNFDAQNIVGLLEGQGTAGLVGYSYNTGKPEGVVAVFLPLLLVVDFDTPVDTVLRDKAAVVVALVVVGTLVFLHNSLVGSSLHTLYSG